MVARGFEAVDERFDSLKEDMEQQFAAVHSDIRSIRENAQRLEAKVDVGFKSIREDIAALAADHIPLGAQTELRKRMERLEDRAGLPHSLQPASA